jgi:hypothetical protein
MGQKKSTLNNAANIQNKILLDKNNNLSQIEVIL